MAHTNRINMTYTAADAAASIAAIQVVENGIPDMVNIDAKERMSLPKMGDLTRSFVAKAMEIAANNPQFVPPYVNLANLSRDYHTCVNLQTVAIQLASLLEKVTDSSKVAGSEAYGAGLLIHNSLKAAERSGTPGAGALLAELSDGLPNKKHNQALPKSRPVE